MDLKVQLTRVASHIVIESKEIEKRWYVKILENIRTVQKSRRLKIKRTKILGKSLGALHTKTIFFAAKRKEDGGREGKGEAYV